MLHRSPGLLLITIMTCTLSLPCIAQNNRQPKTDNKQIEETLMKQFEGLPPEQAKQMRDIMRKALNEASDTSAINPVAAENTEPAFPVKNNSALSALPKHILSATEVQVYVNSIYASVIAVVSEQEKKSIQQLIAGNNDTRLAALSTNAWYFKNSPLTALALAAKAYEKNPKNVTALNNLAALLHTGGQSLQSIPILQYLAKKYPLSAVVCNNLGQSYAALGVKDSAAYYLGRCIKQSPLHPEANNTMAQIELSNKNTSQAAAYAQASLKGGFNVAANSLEDRLPVTNNPLIAYTGKLNLPDGFSVYKFELPPLQLTMFEAAKIDAGNIAFINAVRRQSAQLSELSRQYNKSGTALLQREQQQMMANLKTNPFGYKTSVRLFSAMAWRGKKKMALALANDQSIMALASTVTKSLSELSKNFTSKKVSIEKEYETKKQSLGCANCAAMQKLMEEKCEKINSAGNEYLQDRASIVADQRTKYQNMALQRFFLNSYWEYFLAANKELARGAFYGAAASYLGELELLVFPYSVPPACTGVEKMTTTSEINASWGFDCPVDIEIPAVIGSISINCEEAEFEIGEGVTLNFKHEFASHQSTLTAGFELSIDKTIEVLGTEAKVEATASQGFYITVDGNKKISDVGMKFGVGVSAGVEFTGYRDTKISKGIEGEFGYTIAVNSGFEPRIEFDEGPIGKLFSGETAVNPKIPVYIRK